jgi:hypothetical protein
MKEQQVTKDILSRQQKGMAKYGTTVGENPAPLIEWLNHAYEECLDQAIYLKRAIEELSKPSMVGLPSGHCYDSFEHFMRETVPQHIQDQVKALLDADRLKWLWKRANEFIGISTLAGRALNPDEHFRHLIDEAMAREALGINATLGPLPSKDQFVREFTERADRWCKETRGQSSLGAICMHDDYQTIMAMGEPVIPLILGRLQKVPESWFWALKHLAGQDVAKDTDNPTDAAKAWLKWGIKKGYID